MITNLEIATHLDRIAEAYSMKEDDSRMYAYSRAANSIRNYPTPIVEMKLGPGSIKYVGPSALATINEFISTGATQRLKDLEKEVGIPPEEIRELTKIPGIGIIRATKLWQEHGITTLASLKEALESGKIVDEKLKKSYEYATSQAERIPYDAAIGIANQVTDKLRTFITQEAAKRKSWSPLIKRMEVVGSLRRKKETIKDIDIVCALETDFDRHYLRELVKATWPNDVMADGESKTRLRFFDRQIDLLFCGLENWGAAISYFTGSQSHNIALRAYAKRKGYKVSEHYVTEVNTDTRIFLKEEEDLFKLLGIWNVPPLMRETDYSVNLAIELRDLMHVPGMTFQSAIELRTTKGITNRKELEALNTKL
jgi:DNA polymerase (family X)